MAGWNYPKINLASIQKSGIPHQWI